MLDRLAQCRTDETWLAEQLTSTHSRFLPLWRTNSLFSASGAPIPVTLSHEEIAPFLPDAESLVLLGKANGHTFFAVGLPGQGPAPPEEIGTLGRFRDLRRIAPLLSNEDGTLLAYARAMTYWHTTHRFCGVCGSATVARDAGFVRACSDQECGTLQFPRTDPAVIVLVSDGNRCVLGRKSDWPAHTYSTLAGFVEPGECLEAAIVREVAEEVGIDVHTAVYQSSQPWPFPRSLMLGFLAKTAGGQIKLDDELESARWFSREELATDLQCGRIQLPDALTIAHHLIETWFNEGDLGPLSDIERPR